MTLCHRLLIKWFFITFRVTSDFVGSQENPKKVNKVYKEIPNHRITKEILKCG